MANKSFHLEDVVVEADEVVLDQILYVFLGHLATDLIEVHHVLHQQQHAFLQLLLILNVRLFHDQTPVHHAVVHRLRSVRQKLTTETTVRQHAIQVVELSP